VQTRNKQTGKTIVMCLFIVAVLLLSEAVFAGHNHCTDADEHCVLCMLSSRENLSLAICICTFVATLLILSVSGIFVGKNLRQTLVSEKVKLTN